MAENNNFWVDLIANLKKSQSKKQIQSDAKNLGDIFVPLIGKLNKSKTKAQIQKDLQSIDGSVNVDTKVNKKNIVVSVQNALKQAQSVANKNKVKIDATFDIKKSKLLADIKYFGQQNSKLFKDANMASKYNSLLDNAKLATSNKEIKNLRLQLSALRSEIRSTGQAGLTLGDTLRKTFKRAAELFTGTGFMMLATQQLKQAWQEAMNLDKSFTSLVKVQDELTRSDYPDYLDQCNKKAKELATTQQALIDGATEFSKSGYDLTTSNKLSEQSAILSNVGEMQASESAKAIISGVQAYDTINGYDDVINKAKVLIDLYNEVGNTSAITTKEVAESVQAVGSVFADSNTSVQEFVSLLSAGNRQYQDADALALALRTSALRIRGCTVELEKMGEETDGVYTSASKLEEKIADLTNIDGNGGVKILDGDEFRSIYDIFVDLSKVYKEMSDTDQSALLELIAGKHRASAISATLNNMSEAQEIYKRSLESAGSAQEEYNTYLESSEASLNRFKASMTEAYQSVIDGSTTKGILDAANSTLEFANSIGLVESVLKGFIAISAVKGITALSVAFKASAIEASNFGTALNTVKNMESMTRGTTEYANALNSLKSVSVGLKEAQLKQILANKALDNSTRISILRATGLTKAQAQAKLSQMSLTQSTKAQTVAQNSATASTFSLTAAIRGFGVSLKAAFMSNPVGISIMALSTVIGAVTSKISEHNEAVREARQANMDAASSIREETDELNNLYNKYKNLSSVTDKTSQQEEDFKQVVQDITEALGSKAEVLEGLTAGTDRYTESLEKATKAELESQYATAKIGAKAAEEALKDKTYSSWSGSQITIAKNEQMTGIKEHVAALETVEDILAKYEDLSSNGVEWKPINWDENRNDMNAVIEYYYSLIEAREKLVTSDNADFLMTSDIYKDINTTINDLKDSVENYTEQQYEALKLNYEWQNGIPTTKEELDAMEQSILNASGAGEQFQNVLKGFLTQDFSSLVTQVDNTGEEVKATEQAITSLFDKITSSKESLDKFTSSVESAYESYAKLMNPNVSSSDILSSIQSITSAISDMGGSLDWEFIDGQANSLDLLGAAIEDVSRKYAESILSGAGIDVNSKFGQMLANNIIQAQKASIELENLNDNIDSLQSAYSDLTDIVEAYNENHYLTFDQLQTLLELEPQYLSCLIDEEGQLELNEQALTALANKRLDESQAQAVQQAISELGTLALQDEKTAVEENGNAFYDAISKLASYNQELSTTIAEASVGASAIRDLNAAINEAESQGASDTQVQTVLDNLNAKLQAINSVRDKINSGGLGDVVGNKSSSKSSKDTTESIVWIERAIENLESEIEKLDKIANSAYSSAGEKNQALADQIHKVNEEIQLQQQAYEAYMAKAESVGLSDEYKSLVQNGAITIEDITDEDLKKAIDNYTKWYDKAQDTQDRINDLYEKSNDLHVAAYELHVTELDKIRDNNSITERKYLDYMWALWKKYYESQENLAQQAHETKMKLLDLEKSYLESVASAASNILGEQIDSLKTSQEAEISVLEAKKKPLEEQLALLEDQKEEVDLIRELEDAIFNRRRAENQRNQITYVEGAGGKGQMVYRTDSKAIKEAKTAEEDARFNITKHNLQDQIDYYDDLIDKTNERYDLEISNIEKLQDEWQKALDLEQQALDRVNFTDMFGENSIGKLLSGDMSLINQWKQSYLDTLAEIDITSNGTIGDITKQFAELAGIDLSNTSAQTQDVASQFDTLGESVGNVTASIGGSSGKEEKTENGNTGTENKEEENPETLVGAIQSSYDVASEAIPAQVEMMNSYTDSIQGAIDKVNELISSIERLNTMTMNGIGGNAYASGTVGKAFANGTGNYNGLAHDEKNALRSEYGQPELTVYPDGTTELTTEPTMSDLPKDTVIFNEEQTKRIMNNKGTVVGNAHANGTNDGTIVTKDGVVLRPLQEGDKMYEYIKKFEAYNAKLTDQIVPPVNAIEKNMETIAKNINNVNTNNSVNNSPTVNMTVNCPGITSKEVANQVSAELEKAVFGMNNKALQRVNITR